TIQQVDLSTAVKVETEVPAFYSDGYQSSDYFKVAIPNLEVGDILDYYRVFSGNYAGGIELFISLSRSFPIVHQEFIFDIDKLWNFSYNTFNGAPAFEEDPDGGLDIKSRRRKIVKRFVLEDENRPAQEDIRWDYEYLTKPLLKVGVTPPGQDRDVIRENLDLTKVIKRSAIRRYFEVNSPFYEYVYSDLRKLDWERMSKAELVNTAYHVIRYRFLERYRTSTTLAFRRKGPPSVDERSEIQSDVFAGVFARVLDKFGIDSKLIVTSPRRFGGLDQAVLEREVTFGLYVPSLDTYYWPMTNYRRAGEPDPDLQGAKAFELPPRAIRDAKPELTAITIPESQPVEHLLRTQTEVLINADNTLQVALAASFKGAYKEAYSPVFLYSPTYIEEDFLELSTEEAIQKAHRNKKTPTEEELTAISDAKKEAVLNWVKDDYETEELSSFEVLSPGRSLHAEGELLKVAIAFKVDGAVQKAGPNLIFDIGKLIGGQVQLEPDEKENRKNMIELGYARTIENEVEVTIPVGYVVAGLDNLVYEVDNPAGAFFATAEQNGQTLTIKTRKIYKQQKLQPTAWPQLVEMLEAAYEFSQKKVILKKG
ncbi:MAG: hypothetical protein KDC44_17055, partial [Phaeodactylibacter sp.]|nr:hypothetical protein [Phaeodactylibacter sp.]